jgi:hypothetical protein
MKIRLENFRLFEDSNWFNLSPLTFLVGRNSSGKTSILSAILLLKQSIEQEAMTRGVTPLILSGPYCDLGGYSDVVHNHDSRSDISFSFSMKLADLQKATEQSSAPIVSFAVPRTPSLGRIGFFYSPRELKLPSKGEVQARLTFSVSKPFGPSLSRVKIEVTNAGTGRFVRTISGERRQHWRTYVSGLPPRAIAFSPQARSLFPRISIRDKTLRRSSPEGQQAARTFFAVTSALFRYLQRALWDSSVIGPFRTPPERRYAFGGFGASRGGPNGEQAVNLLITESMLRPSETASLHSSLAFWIKHLKLAKSLRVRDIAKRLNLFEVDVKAAGLGVKANLADVGFGVSQILPVLVEGLLMRRGGIYLVQQPEIHLHPDAQAGLADFFIYLACNGVITIVETHSEYLLLRLRRRLAEGGQAIVPHYQRTLLTDARLDRSDVAVLFTGAEKGRVIVRQLEIGETFQFENLPTGFMSQALDDRVGLLKILGKRNA